MSAPPSDGDGDGDDSLSHQPQETTTTTNEEEPTPSSSPSSSLFGVTPSGEKFAVPKTPSVMSLNVKEWSALDYIQFSSVFNLLFLLFPLPGEFFITWFIFWRLAYNVGIGIVLHKQSESEWFSHLFRRLCKDPSMRDRILQMSSLGMGEDFNFYAVPDEFNAWLCFRVLVDFILANDLVSYFVFCIKYWEAPESAWTALFFYPPGICLCLFGLWAKTDSYRVVKDFAWYWGDFFFLIDQNLTFDRVFAISPHPMYTIGYAFYYGLALLTQSYSVLCISVLAHLCQLLFLDCVETPHMEKIYSNMVDPEHAEHKKTYQESGYFRSDLIVFKNFKIYRSGDLAMLLAIIYITLTAFFPLHPLFYIMQTLFWRLLYSFGLGYLLHLQSKNNFYVSLFTDDGMTKKEAFDNWKSILNICLVMNSMSFFICAFKLASWTVPWESTQLLVQHVVGLLFVALSVWSTMSTYSVLGEFGWFYGDFFLDELPSKPVYTGVYRFLNNPDCILGFASHYGFALMANSWTVFVLALICQISHYLFFFYVEKPHMKKVYGDRLQPKSGMSVAVSSIIEEGVVETKTTLNRALEKTKQTKNKLKGVMGGALDKAKNNPLSQLSTSVTTPLGQLTNRIKKGTTNNNDVSLGKLEKLQKELDKGK